jgi:DNA-binding transcriptional MerR regulator
LDKAPDAFRTISEVADDLDIPQHVLRFWESRFTQIRPMKRGGGRRYYRPDDIALLHGIRHLLYGQGYTIRGVQRILREQGIGFVQTVWEEGAEQPEHAAEDEIHTDSPDAEAAVAGPPPAAPKAERREPIFASAAANPVTSPVPNPVERLSRANVPIRTAAPAASINRSGLQSALEQLAECRRLLDAALEEKA